MTLDEYQIEIVKNQIDWTNIKTVLEIGFKTVYRTDFFLSHPDVSVVSFENTSNDDTFTCKQYIDEKYPGRHEMVATPIPKFETRTFDLIFIEGGRELEDARANLVNCMRFAGPETVVVVDNIIYEHTLATKHSVGPTRAWMEFIRISAIEETFHVDLADGRGMSLGRYKIFHNFSIKKSKVIDAFMFYNELDMLKYRLTVMGPHVDQFLICECPVSFAGNPKPLYFEENKQMFEPWLHKITHIVWKGYRSPVNDLDDSWFNDNTQRNYLLEGLKDCKPNDIVIIGDLDEIVSPTILNKIDEVLGPHPIVKLSMDMYYYDIEHRSPYTWDFTRIARYHFVRDTSPHMCRNTNRIDPIVDNAGWHLSYFGNENFIINKIKNYAHLEAFKVVGEEKGIREYIKNGFGISTSPLQCCYVPVKDNPHLPPRLDILPHQII